jgi:hypothetical protein
MDGVVHSSLPRAFWLGVAVATRGRDYSAPISLPTTDTRRRISAIEASAAGKSPRRGRATESQTAAKPRLSVAAATALATDAQFAAVSVALVRPPRIKTLSSAITGAWARSRQDDVDRSIGITCRIGVPSGDSRWRSREPNRSMGPCLLLPLRDAPCSPRFLAGTRRPQPQGVLRRPARRAFGDICGGRRWSLGDE